MAVMRTRRGTILAKIESTEGVDAAPAAGDAILAENLRLTFDPGLVTTNEMTGSLDPEAPIVGGLKASVTFDVYLKGSGSAGTAPEFGPLFKACGWQEVVTGAAIGAPTTASAGTTGTVTLGTSATTTAQAYRGMPIVLSGNPATPAATFITNYTSGKVATLARNFSPALTTATLWQIPANVLYRPTSDDSLIKSVSMYFYMDGVLVKMLGSRGTFVITHVAGQPAKIAFTFTGMYGGKTDAAVVAGTFDATRPPIWRDPNGDASGHFSIGKVEAALRQFVFTNGNQNVYPDNPNEAEGFQPTVIASRRMTGSMDPLATLVATRNLMDDFRNGTQRLVHSRIGTVAGNRIGLTIPLAHPENYTPGDREGLATEEVPFFCAGKDAGAFMCFW
ncbi:MAG: hypothetical protein AB7P02_09405 [Alphaproteobacteria bacterium]